MGKAGKALKQVLNNYGLSQNKLAVMLKIERGNVYRWVHEIRDPTAETVAEIAEGLYHINPAAADEFRCQGSKLPAGNRSSLDR